MEDLVSSSKDQSVGAVPEITSCEVCGSTTLVPVLDLGSHPMCDDLVAIGDSRVCEEYPIEILFCDTCITAHQRFQVPKRQLFPLTYHYRSRFTADVLRGMDSLVESCQSKFGDLAGKRVLDVGCNDGSLLSLFRKRGAVTVGIEPTDAALDAQRDGHLTFQEFLSMSLADEIVARVGRPDFVVFTNVFAHIEDLKGVVCALRRLMGPETVLIVENHYLGSVLDGNQFDTFYHEHPRTYSFTSFTHIARSLQFPLTHVEFPSRYGGNIRVFAGGPPNADVGPQATEVLERERKFRERFAVLRDNIERWRVRKHEWLARQIDREGPLRAKAFPGRAAILVKLLGIDETWISTVYEKPGSMKVGHYVPGTRIPIASDDDLFAAADQSRVILNLAWHIPGEIRSYLTQHGYTGPVVDILEPSDFQP